MRPLSKRLIPLAFLIGSIGSSAVHAQTVIPTQQHNGDEVVFGLKNKPMFTSNNDYQVDSSGKAGEYVYKGAMSTESAEAISSNCDNAINSTNPLTMSPDCAKQAQSGGWKNAAAGLVAGAISGIGSGLTGGFGSGDFSWDNIGNSLGNAAENVSNGSWWSGVTDTIGGYVDQAGNAISNYWEQNGDKLIGAAGAAVGAYAGSQLEKVCDGCGVLGASIGTQLGSSMAGTIYQNYQINSAINDHNAMVDIYNDLGIAGPNDQYIQNVNLADMNWTGGFDTNKVQWSSGFANIAQANGVDQQWVGAAGAFGNVIGQGYGNNAQTFNQSVNQFGNAVIKGGTSTIYNNMDGPEKYAFGKAANSSSIYNTPTYNNSAYYQQPSQSTYGSYNNPMGSAGGYQASYPSGAYSGGSSNMSTQGVNYTYQPTAGPTAGTAAYYGSDPATTPDYSRYYASNNTTGSTGPKITKFVPMDFDSSWPGKEFGVPKPGVEAPQLRGDTKSDGTQPWLD